LCRPRNGFQKVKKFYRGVYLQPRSNLFYQKFLTKTSARRPKGGGQEKPVGSRVKNFLPWNPSIFCPLTENFLSFLPEFPKISLSLTK